MREGLPMVLLVLAAGLLVWISGAAGRLNAENPGAMVALVNSQDILTANSYDSFESPRGTDYQVPAGQTIYITNLLGFPHSPASTSEHFHIGYGDTAVNDSVAAPTNAIIVCDYSWESADGPPAPVPMFCPIPAGKYPFVQPSGDGNFQATGEVR